MFKGANYIKNRAGIIQDYFGYDAAKVLEVKSNDEIKVLFYDFKVLGRPTPTKSIMSLEHDGLYHFLDTYSLHSIDGVVEIEKPCENKDDNIFMLGLLLSKYKEQKKVAEVLGVSPAQVTRWKQGEKMSPKRIKQCKDITKGISQ